MENYIYEDIVKLLLVYLDHNSSFNYLNTCKKLIQYKSNLYGKYKFWYSRIVNSEYFPFVKHILVERYENIVLQETEFPDNLETIIFTEFGSRGHADFSIFAESIKKPINLSKLPKKIKSLEFTMDDFDLQFEDLPENLESLFIWCKNFDKSLDGLPKTLKSLRIECMKFNKSLDNLPNTLTTLYIWSKAYNRPLIKLPENLKSLTIWSNSFNQSLNHLPNSLKMINISGHMFNQSLNNIPQQLELLFINSNSFDQKLPQIQKVSKSFGVTCKKSNKYVYNSVINNPLYKYQTLPNGAILVECEKKIDNHNA